MPRHTFKFPKHIRDEVQRYVELRIQSLEVSRFRQEHNYTAALVTGLHGTAYDRSDGVVKFRATTIDDRGRGSAESIYGPDMAFTADISGPGGAISKAILIQVKLGLISELSPAGMAELREQIRKMRAKTRSPKVMELPLQLNTRDPRIISGNRISDDEPYRSVPLSKYITSRVLTTLDGDTRPDSVAVQIRLCHLCQVPGMLSPRSSRQRSQRVGTDLVQMLAVRLPRE